MVKNLSLRFKIMLPVVVLSLVILSFFTWMSYRKTYSLVVTDAKIKLSNLSLKHGADVREDLQHAFTVARTYRDTILSRKREGYFDRSLSIGEMRAILDDNKEYIGFWMGWEPNAFDGKDSEFVSTKWHEKSGRYLPWWARAEGKLVYEPLITERTPELGEYYNLPRETLREELMEPYLDDINGVNLLMTSTVVPIIHDQKFLGVVGVDIALAKISSEIQKIKPYEHTRSFLVSSGGKFVSNSDSEKLTKDFDLEFQSDEVLAAIKSGEVFSDIVKDKEGSNFFVAVVPVKVGQYKGVWSLILVTPEKDVLVGVSDLRNYQIALSVFGLFLMIALVALMSGRISKEIQNLTGKLDESTHNVNNAITQLSLAGQSLSQSSTQSASSLEEVVASLEELTTMVNLNSSNAIEAANLSAQASVIAGEGESEIKELVQSMAEISKDSKQIEDIINVIEDIAFQTNLLALNAAVEAARAGEQGKGFAVVAEAVRNLAQRSGEAAKNITGLIKASVMKIEDGSTKADVSGEALVKILSAVNKVSSLNKEISQASQEQAIGITQISKAMNQLDQSVQSNAASSEEIAGTAEEIKRQSDVMRDVVLEINTEVNGKRGG